MDSCPRRHGRRAARIAAVAALLALSPGPLASQDSTAVRPGDRVRVTLPRPPGRTRPREVTGTLIALQPPVITIARPGDTLALGLDSVLALEVSLGRTSRERHFAMVGAALGLVVGLGVSQLTHPAAEDPTPREIIFVSLLGGFVGTGLGVVVGREMRTDRWERVR